MVYICVDNLHLIDSNNTCIIKTKRTQSQQQRTATKKNKNSTMGDRILCLLFYETDYCCYTKNFLLITSQSTSIYFPHCKISIYWKTKVPLAEPRWSIRNGIGPSLIDRT